MKGTLNPDAYHGQGKKPPFFEGWYYKLVDASGEHPAAIIPGIYLDREAGRSHAFVQVFTANPPRARYFRFPVSQFSWQPYELRLRIGDNRFHEDMLHLNLRHDGGEVIGNLAFKHLQKWPVTLLAPGIMGWYAWVPFMQCYHGIVSLDHAIAGELVIDGRRYRFDGGRGYIEKDWGTGFPASWVWMQSNHFSTRGSSLTGSLAIIPWIRGSFAGFIVGLWHAERLYRFTTYSGARIDEFEVKESTALWTMSDRNHRLRLSVTHRPPQGAVLMGPTEKGMLREIDESLDSRLSFELYRIKNGKEVLAMQDESDLAGAEMIGDLGKLRSMARKRYGF